MEKTPAELLKDYYLQCGEEVTIMTEEKVSHPEYNTLKVFGGEKKEDNLLFTLYGNNLSKVFESIMRGIEIDFMLSSMEEYDSAD